MKKFPFYKQLYAKDCGPTCLRMIAKYYGKIFSIQHLRELTQNNKLGANLIGLSDAAEAIGFKTLSVKIPFDQFRDQVPLPCIAYWQKRHFLVVYKFSKTIVYVADPAYGLVKYTHEEFKKGWLNTVTNNQLTGILLAIEATPTFYAAPEDKINKTSWALIFSYLKPYKRFIIQLLLGMLVGSILMLILPFLTQAIVDVGIVNHDPNFINLILIAQFALTIGRTSVDFIRSWILFHISSRLNLFILSDFLIKLMKLPVSFFDTKQIGDLLQRINDQKRIESFLSSTTLSFLFSFLNLIIFGIILITYNFTIFCVNIIGSLIHLTWVLFFLKRRREYNYKAFDQSSLSQSNIIQLLTGMQEIKLHNSEKLKRWEWERLQSRQFRLSQTVLSLSQYEQAGSILINETKNILITYLTAQAVIEGNITFGAMLSVQYIIGQFNAPLSQLIGFTHTYQEAQISLERLEEIHQHKNEEDIVQTLAPFPTRGPITFTDVTFSYPGGAPVLQKISLSIPDGKTTAIVGASGSGKTTLIKLLLRFYDTFEGDIKLGHTSLKNLSIRHWRDHCGAVLQDGFIFSDSIARNIVVNEEDIDWERLHYAINTANLQTFIESLPLGYQTKIGADGQGLSQGQKQRLLIARAVYKNPDFIFFDEATNALDANNEKAIMENLNRFLQGKTVIVIAHRLSTVVNADQIIVLDKGEIIERGTHQSLIKDKANYYQLVKNQLELGN